MRTRQYETFMGDSQPKKSFEGVATIGTVVDTNDPQQMGRIRVICPVLGEGMNSRIADVPWSLFVSPMAGHTEVGTRGPDDATSRGSIAYGLWSRPKVGAQVVVMFIDGDPRFRVCMGAIFDQYRPHTMPHGRFMYDDHPALDEADNRRPFGPYTSDEHYIEPLNTNMREAFPKSEPNYEWRTRVADYQVSAIDVSALTVASSRVPDDKDVTFDGFTSQQGYQVSRQDPEFTGLFGEGNLDSQVSSWTSPGFHAFSMDDSKQNCRMRFRTTSGHQILMDDTNERLYIATAQGNNWIELDQAGNIDIYTANKVNIHAAKDINLTSDQTVRLYGATGLHFYSGGEIRMQSVSDIHVKTAQNWRLHAQENIYVQATQEINETCNGDFKITSGTVLNLKADASILGTAAEIHFNGPGAATADPANEKAALWTNRVPAHEPWARTMTKDDTTHDPEFPYTSSEVNRNERGTEIPRGPNWRR